MLRFPFSILPATAGVPHFQFSIRFLLLSCRPPSGYRLSLAKGQLAVSLLSAAGRKSQRWKELQISFREPENGFLKKTGCARTLVLAIGRSFGVEFYVLRFTRRSRLEEYKGTQRDANEWLRFSHQRRLNAANSDFWSALARASILPTRMKDAAYRASRSVGWKRPKLDKCPLDGTTLALAPGFNRILLRQSPPRQAHVLARCSIVTDLAVGDTIHLALHRAYRARATLREPPCFVGHTDA
jgi:hypothetical protein